MKQFLQRALLLASGLIMSNGILQAQTLVGTIITQPCNNNGQISVTATGLIPPISYTCNNYMANQSIVHSAVNSLTDVFTNLKAYQNINYTQFNTWSILASDGVNSANVTVILNPAFQDSIKVSPGLCPANSTLQAINFLGGTPPYSCVWTNMGNSATYNTNPAFVSNGNYSVVITDGAGCKVSSAPGFSSNINVTSISSIVLTMGGSAANCTNGTASVTGVSGGTPPYTYFWNNSAVSQNISGLTSSSYNCQVTDALGCQTTGYYYVSQAVTITYNSTPTNPTCLQNNGSILSFVTGGTAPYSYFWSNSANTANISGLTAGTYIVQVTDANGCNGTGYVGLSATTPINATYLASPSACTLASGSATLSLSGGQSPYSTIWYTFPTNSTGLTLSNKAPGNYAFKVTDANGCIRTGSAYIPPVSTLSAGINSAYVICPATNGNLTTSVSGSNPPFTYAWSNSATTSSLTGVALGYYTCVITDAVGCSVNKAGGVSQISPISLGFNATPATCLFSANGSCLVTALGGAAPYSYLWSNAQTGNTATGLLTGAYYVTVTDANGCTKTNNNNPAYVGYNPANTSCYCTISGTVYADANVNCVRNTGEAGIPNIPVQCSGYGIAYTNANGVYSFKVPSGTYTVTELVQTNYPLTGCQSNNIVVNVTAAPACLSVVNFANSILPTNDLHIISTNQNQPIPGGTYQQRVIIQNDGTNTQSTIKFGYRHDAQLGYSSCAPWVVTQQNLSVPSWFSGTNAFSSLSSSGSTSTYFYYNVPANIPLGTLVNFYDTVARTAPIAVNWLSDVSPWNNVNHLQTTVIGSYDPNFKEVSPQGTGPQGYITKNDSVLDYVVHFQNTGSYFAQNVVVIDTLDSDLIRTSLRPGFSDHAYTVTISETGVARFAFDNIRLPWKSGYGDLGSSGMFTYSIKQKKNLAVGTQIKNKAAIYFDYNQAVITNETLNTIAQATTTGVGLSELRGSGSTKMQLFPNPASTYFDLSYESADNTVGNISIYDLSGREISSENIDIKSGTNTFRANSSHLQNGIYLIQFKAENSIQTGKLIISK